MGVANYNKTGFVAAAGKIYRFAIPAPPRGEIVRAQVVQTAGGKTAFAYTFFNSAASCPPDPLDPNGNPVPPTPATTVDQWVEYAGQIGPTRNVTNTQDRWMGPDGNDGGWTSAGAYANADGGGSTAKGQLYMKFAPSGAGTFAFFLTIKTDKG